MKRFIPTRRDIVVLLLTLTLGTTIIYLFPQTVHWVTGSSVPKPDLHFRELTDEERALYKSLHVEVVSGNSAGSGCKLDKDGKEYLTALHVVMTGFVNDETIWADNHATKVVEKSKFGPTEKDYAILSTDLTATKPTTEIPYYRFREGEDVIVVGSSGNQKALVQPARIINVSVDSENGKPKPSAKNVYAIYLKEGLSGGCVYPIGWTTPVAVFAKRDQDLQRGEVSLASRLIE